VNQNQPSLFVCRPAVSAHSHNGLLQRTLLGTFLLLVLSAPAWASGGNGMTWVKGSHNSTTGTDIVGCVGCDPYVGDTACTTSLPVLCFKSDGSPAPSESHFGLPPWMEGRPHFDDTFNPWHDADQPRGSESDLRELSGRRLWNRRVPPRPGWLELERVRQRPTDYRFWTYINDQLGNCWN
jgi:hypothetical protein